MIDEATLRRIIREELDNYDRDKGVTPRVSRGGLPPPPFSYDTSKCHFCGGYHGSNMPCPKLAPTCVSL